MFVGMPGTLPCSCFHELNLATMSEPEKANEAAARSAKDIRVKLFKRWPSFLRTARADSF